MENQAYKVTENDNKKLGSNNAKGKRVLMLLENCTYPRDDRVRHEAQTLLHSGYQVSVISPGNRKQLYREIVDGIDVYRFPLPPNSDGLLGYVWEYFYSMLALFILSLKVWFTKGFDILHTAQPPDVFVFIALFFKLFGKCYVLDHHDLAPELYNVRFDGEGNNLIHRVLLWFEKLSMNVADRVISTNQSYKEVALRRGHVADERIFIVRNGPDLDELRCQSEKPIFSNNGKVTIGYVGVTGIQDGLNNLIRAIYHLVHDFKRKNIKCLIVGDGVAMPIMKSLAEELNVAEYFQYTGWVTKQSEIVRYLNSMEICVAPEPSDPYNDRSTAAKLMEYMAMAKPIVAFDLPEHRFTAQNAALYAQKPHDEYDFAKKIAELMDDPARCFEMGQIGKTRVDTILAWQFQAKNLLKAYEGL